MASGVDFTQIMKAQGYECSPRCAVAFSLAHVAGLALFIIGCVGAAGAFPGPIGWVTVGLAGVGFALQFAIGNLQARKIELILSAFVTAILITVGALGGAGILSATQVGWGIIGTTLGSIPLNCIASCLKIRQMRQLNATV